MLYNESFTDLLPQLGHVFLFTCLAKGNDSVKQMERICLSSSCRNLISPNSCLALYKHEVRESPISNQSRPVDVSNWRGGGLRGEHHDGLMCSCLCPLMPSPISCTTKSCDLSHRKSPDTCRTGRNNSISSKNVSECIVMTMVQFANSVFLIMSLY